MFSLIIFNITNEFQSGIFLMHIWNAPSLIIYGILSELQ